MLIDHDGGMIRSYSAQGTVRVVRRVLLDDVPGVFRAATRRFSVELHKATDHRHWWNEIQRFSVELHKTTEPSHWRNEVQKRSVGACPAPTTPFFKGSASSSLKGSKYHVQRWVNEYAQELQRAIGDAFPHWELAVAVGVSAGARVVPRISRQRISSGDRAGPPI